MSALDDGPPHVLRSPDEHYLEADKLLHEVANTRDMSLPYVRRKIEMAQVHAMLAQCFQHDAIEDAVSYDFNADPYKVPPVETHRATGDRL